MYRNMRYAIFLIVLAGMPLSLALAGCGAANATKPPATEAPQGVAQSTATTEAATAVPTTAIPAPTRTPAPPTPTEEPATLTPTAGPAQTITQQIVIRNSGGEAGITSESTFTMTARIQVGVVDGINYTSAAAPMPSGAETYVATNLPKIGDVVQGADGLVVQVTGVKTVDVDADNEFILVDLVVGNAGKERQLISTDPCMEIVSGDGHWYSGFWYSLYWTGISAGADDAYVLAMRKQLHDKLLQLNLTSDFSAAIEPGKAAKGTAVFPVPKSARQLAFGLQSWGAAMYLAMANEANPTIFVPLGLRGGLPTIPSNVAALAPKTTYKVGQSFRANKRRVAFQVQSAWKRLESLGNMWILEPDEQFVVVNLIVPGGTPLDQTRELSLVDGSGKAFALQEYASDYLAPRLGRYNQRGVVVFKGPRAATGLKLRFTPLDPATMTGDAPQPLTDEAVAIDLGRLAASSVAGTRAATAEPTLAQEATTTPRPTATAVHSTNPQVGQRVVIGDLAVTVNKAETQAGPENYQAQEGSTWVLVYVTLENVSNRDIGIDPEGFDCVDEEGIVYNNLLNRPSAWEAIRSSVLAYVQLSAGGKLQNKLLVIEVGKAALPGLKLRFTADDGNRAFWDLGL